MVFELEEIYGICLLKRRFYLNWQVRNRKSRWCFGFCSIYNSVRRHIVWDTNCTLISVFLSPDCVREGKIYARSNWKYKPFANTEDIDVTENDESSKQKNSNGTYGLNIWKGVLNGCKYQKEIGRYFERKYRIGKNVIWNDWWRSI